MNESWTIAWAARNILANALMPPLLWLLLAIFALLFLNKRRKLQYSTLVLSIILLWVTSTVVFSQAFTGWVGYLVNWPKPLMFDEISTLPKPQAIVILGGGVRRGAQELPDYQTQDISKEGMERLRMGARLAKSTHLPVLVAGGLPDKTNVNELAEGTLMAIVLEKELGTSVKWIEKDSNTTHENALFSAKILKNDDIQKIYLVTHFWHIPRAMREFTQAGFEVIPVPLGFDNKEKFTPLDYLPGASGLLRTQQVWHELLGWVLGGFKKSTT
ncbi:YdcF family protein [Polynucleobacter rarus]|uniref:YdcF family protein n=1 Tax=Polynucleobacter rarus TaxID=556055 RepID=UPI000D3E8B38|nr:YdcF family protein [Polynucleobacter rarus]